MGLSGLSCKISQTNQSIEKLFSRVVLVMARGYELVASEFFHNTRQEGDDVWVDVRLKIARDDFVDFAWLIFQDIGGRRVLYIYIYIDRGL